VSIADLPALQAQLIGCELTRYVHVDTHPIDRLGGMRRPSTPRHQVCISPSLKTHTDGVPDGDREDLAAHRQIVEPQVELVLDGVVGLVEEVRNGVEDDILVGWTHVVAARDYQRMQRDKQFKEWSAFVGRAM
jgi:hypothetical protein